MGVMFNYDFWSNPEEVTEVTFFLPNGVLIILKYSIYATLQDLKADVWEEAERYPLYCHLGDKSMYFFSTVSSANNTSYELNDETKRLIDVQPVFCMFRFVEKQVSVNNKLINNITTLLGKTLSEKTLKNPEVNDFRTKMSYLGEDIANKRAVMNRMERISYQYPPKLVSSQHIPELVKKRITNGDFCVVAKSADMQVTVKIPCKATPDEVIKRILEKKQISANTRNENSCDFILKVCGREEYMFGEHPIINFQYVQDTLSREETPTFVPKLLRNVEIFEDNIYEIPEDITQRTNSTGSKQPSHTLRKVKYVTSWDIDSQFQCTVHGIADLNCDANRNVEVGIQLGLFHGGKSLCKPMKTQLVALNGGSAMWDENIVFDIDVKNVPRMARLCLVIYENVRTAKGIGVRARRTKDGFMNPIAWVNTMVYDYKNQMKAGAVTLYTWTYAEDSQSEDVLHPLGTVEPNPRRDECSSIILSFHNYNQENKIIVYPSEDQLLDHAVKMRRINRHLNRDSAEEMRPIKEILLPYMHNDRLNDMHEQDRNAIWAKRRECMTLEPDGLPCLLYCVEWNDRNEVAEITSLLQEWPVLPLERALELLDYAYADQYVRRYAVKCLRAIQDDELLLYLLQLVQAMKHESYLYCDLVDFLLQRALNNQHIGHFFFWHLRSEIQVPSVQVRFGLILEAYLKGSQEHVSILLKQMQCLRKLQQGSELVKKGNKEKGKSLLTEYLQERTVGEAMSDVISPLNPSFRCKAVRAEKCKVMDSKMRPLWIVYQNSDINGDDINMIFKNGDDLRQDMLTLQMLRIMDRIWKSHGYDFRMNPYSCISTDRRLGIIEVVLNAETIANIQKEKGMFSATSPFKKGSLLAWLKEHNSTEELQAKAVQEFTLSCAGYCVATYVLGVADRHSDNIMVKKTGQLFHIDFGHILGHFKEKFGFRRERVPFVLTHDFVYVINKGRTDREAHEFRQFQHLCEEAFLILRKHGCLILSLFAMMISTGLPELSSEKDLNYLRETLVLDLPEAEAREHFKSKFSEALANSWKTSLNWASHNFSKNNKQ
ncbi:phosphatidylinositol 4,5-bisphosphate 3-kinase catalytic subunit beta isoform [Toxorhynchites rutilus septentrionalis]|uniref:phosphatidylinositol 4,5-bisphosphate 3-kinase catalytic subunit beta isoform n=1 Tax=Toxorhynchites rutilus septentrionalis TaxID=329112 RepID=UPI002478DB4D|nr:phosphatidylinositol 4,5-bisphosphate 3-kinase catalytic subunit beta isoform [Toxorhynchites rutilus septentrionalis]XP_055620480.1 phosphatidylinositol 4,5-bisphosphate 3-kinase catalytic subunit beta isoform [Toxorhynchites rutilus septentrionalis]XP_055620490.1 phosphatidylinositol 4,5-bisphosphate 3-kinase catalytic subunit beta isoform [Toxorhynchites rutilus septentrionalis]XP_055620500.1 phosphatidylinositol 4,5-bisphosphate 3-kinase catalytic subunit beta isoform [Toxorhynchites ruti